MRACQRCAGLNVLLIVAVLSQEPARRSSQALGYGQERAQRRRRLPSLDLRNVAFGEVGTGKVRLLHTG